MRTTQHVLSALRATNDPMSACRLSVALDLDIAAVTRALWALKAAGLATADQVGLGTFWRAAPAAQLDARDLLPTPRLGGVR